MSNNEKLSPQESFNQGVIFSLLALKQAILSSPGFNNAVLVEAVERMIKLPPLGVDHEAFIEPLKTLIGGPTTNSNT